MILKKWTKADVTPEMVRATYAEQFSAVKVQSQIDAATRYKVLKTSFPASDLFAPGVTWGP